MPKTIQELELSRQELMEHHWDRENNCWRADTEEERKELQRKFRIIKNSIRFIKESAAVENPATPQDIVAQLLPLVERRKLGTMRRLNIKFNTPDGEAILEDDGEQFCFEPQTYTDVRLLLCGCGFYAPAWRPSNMREEVEANEHLKVCKMTVMETLHEPIMRIKHVRGDWECRGCLNTGLPVQAQEGLASLAVVKYLDWCPNFPEEIRSLNLHEISKLSGIQVKCYAGLMHSQVEFGSRDSYVIAAGLNGESAKTKYVQHIKIVRLCDTCGHRIEEEKTSEWEAAADEVVL
jgi:hypothetical protein